MKQLLIISDLPEWLLNLLVEVARFYADLTGKSVSIATVKSAPGVNDEQDA